MAGHAPDISVPQLPKAKVAIISSSWHMDICGDLVTGATRALTAANVKTIKTIYVPGSFEIPLAAQKAFEKGFDAAVVLGVVISFVGNNLTALLADRKATILKNLQEANQRAIEAEEKLNEARALLESAKKKAQEIREEGVLRATQEINTVVSQHEIRLSKLDEFKQETLTFYQEKAFKEAYLYVISRIMTRVREKLNSGLNSTYHVVVNNFYVSRFTEYNPK